MIALLTITALAGALRVWRLTIPPREMFDEDFYGRDACYYVTKAAEACGLTGDPQEVHPPLGKWLIASGIKLFGFDAFGVRIGAAVAGTLTVALLYVLGRKLLGSTLGASVAAGVLALDLLHFVHSRIATLDAFATFFGVAAFVALAFDRDDISGSGGTRIRGRPWRLVCGSLLGAAIATRWAGALLLAAAVALTLLWETRARRERGRARPFDAALREAGLPMLFSFALVPAVVYLAAYLGRLDAASPAHWLARFWHQQAFMWDYLVKELPPHGFQSQPWEWLLAHKGIPYFFGIRSGQYAQVLAIGNPLVWLPASAMAAYMAIRWIRHRDHTSPEAFIAAGFLLAFLPWVLLSAAGRDRLFIYYLLPALPFMALALGYVAARAGSRLRILVVSATALATIGAFAYLYPVVAAVPLDVPAWKARALLYDICPAPDPNQPPDATVQESLTCANER